MDSAESRAFSTSSRIVVYRDLPGWPAPLHQYLCEIMTTMVSDRFPTQKCTTTRVSNIRESKQWLIVSVCSPLSDVV